MSLELGAPYTGHSAPATALSRVSRAFAQHALLLGALGFLALFVLTDLRELASHRTEWADYAADSIRARDAWSQTTGIHSRWGFHHPGPALFWLLRCGDLLATAIGLAPAAGHVLIVAVVATACLATLVVELGLAARPTLPPVAFVLAWILLPDHRAGMPWAPVVANWFVLLGAAGAVSLANGRRRGMTLSVLAVGVLVHLHVLAGVLGAMVGVVAVLAAWPARDQLRLRQGASLGAVAVAVVLVLPPVIALLHGDSPVGAYLHHSGAAGVRQSPGMSLRVLVSLLVPHVQGAPDLAVLWTLLALAILGTPFVLLMRSQLPRDVRVGAAVAALWAVWLVCVSRMDFLTPENLGSALPLLVGLLCLAAAAAGRPSALRWTAAALLLTATLGAVDLNPSVDRWAEPLRPTSTGERALVSVDRSHNGTRPAVAIDYATDPWRTYGVAAQAALRAERQGRPWCLIARRWPYWAEDSDICTPAQRRAYLRLTFEDTQHYAVQLPSH